MSLATELAEIKEALRYCLSDVTVSGCPSPGLLDDALERLENLRLPERICCVFYEDDEVSFQWLPVAAYLDPLGAVRRADKEEADTSGTVGFTVIEIPLEG